MLRSRLLTVLLASTIALLILPAAASAAFGPLAGINSVGGGPTDTTFQLDYPDSVVRVPDGPNYSFYVADSSNNRIVKLDQDGKFLFAFGGHTGTAEQMSSPRSIAYGGGYLYVATNGYYIRKYSLTGQLVTEWGGYSATPADGTFNNIGGIAYDPAWGQIYAADAQNNRIQWFDDDGVFRGKLGSVGSGNGQFYFPRDVSFGNGGARLLVLDSGNNRVSYFDRGGAFPNFTYTYAGSFGNSSTSDPNGMTGSLSMTVDGSALSGHGDRIYVTLGEPLNTVKVFEGSASSAPPFTSNFSWGGTGTSPSNLNNPSDVFAVGTDVFVADAGNGRVSHFSGLPGAATPAESWGKNPAADGYLRSGWRSAVAPDGSIYVVDSLKTRIQRFAANGDFLVAWGTEGTGDGEFANNGIAGIAVDPAGNVLVSDSTTGRVQRFGPNGTFIESIQWNPIGGAASIAPGPIRTDASGDIYVYDYAAHKLVELTSSGVFSGSFGENGTSELGNFLYGPNDFVVSPDGDTIYFMDSVRLKKFTRSGGVWTGHPASQSNLGSGTGQLQFSNAFSIALDPISGELLVADSANNRVQRISEASDVYTWHATYGELDGGFGESDFISPNAVAVDRWGNMSVVDGGSDSIKRYGDAPTVTIDAPTSGASTEAASIPVSFTSSDPGADCDFDSGDPFALAVGANTINVECSNLQGTGAASVNVTRTVPAAPPKDPPAQLPTPAVDTTITFKLAKKIKLAKKLKLSITCPVGCVISAKVKIGKKSYTFKPVVLPASRLAQIFGLSPAKTTREKVLAGLADRRSVSLYVTPALPQAYGATKGKTGKATLVR